MFTNIQTVKRIGRFFRTNRESSNDGSNHDVDTDSQGGNQTQRDASTTKFGTTLFKKTENNISTEYNYRAVDKEFGDSDDESGEEREAFEGNNDSSFYSFNSLDQNELKEKSPGFDDFFRVNEDDIQFIDGGGRTDIVSNVNNSSNDCDIYNNGTEYHVS